MTLKEGVLSNFVRRTSYLLLSAFASFFVVHRPYAQTIACDQTGRKPEPGLVAGPTADCLLVVS